MHEALTVGQHLSPTLAAAACRELAYVEFLRGRYLQTLSWLGRAMPFATGDDAEQARIQTVHGAVLSDTAHYAAAIAMLRDAVARGDGVGDTKQVAYALSMLGRALLLQGDLQAAADPLDRSIRLAQQCWTAFVPWPQSLRAEIDLTRGDVEAAAVRLEVAYALGCQLDDPCWEGIAGRGLGRVAIARGEPQGAAKILISCIERCVRLPDAYLWGKGYALDTLCGLAVVQAMPKALVWITELHNLAARSGMRELTVRAYLHRAALGDSASGGAAWLLASQIDNPVLHAMIEIARGDCSGG